MNPTQAMMGIPGARRAPEAKSVSFPVEEIKKWVPHRDPFLLIDEIVEFSPMEFCKSSRRIDPDDRIFKGHFPGSPVMPGVLLIENMAQTACFLMSYSDPGGPEGRLPALGQVNKCSFLSKVRPGDVVETVARLERTFETLAVFSCHSTVNGIKVAKAELVVSLV
jgi:3-hydroxyacyl-[acyl-carrier-protein] dehydratase